ncbi:reverse transcriptase domain-containing protein [Tanacetum coccineum]|uniref:Reverse transcriptase domain-containing protein n=1 Tax=Tanacetum coccineum TaxID=301880 RepID=A0ABQ4XAK2_9ASTR
MRTRSSSNLVGNSSSNPTTSNPKRRNRRRSNQRVEPFALEESPVGYAEAIAVPPILAEHFELKHSLINMMTSDQFFELEKDNPHDHIPRWWLEKEPPRSITTWDDLVSKFINEFFPPSRTTNLRNEISNFQQKFDESFHEAWDRYKDLLRACPHHGFTELHQLDTFYNALNPSDQDSLNSAAGGNLLERSTQDVLTIIENKAKVRSSRNKSVVSQVKSSDATPTPASVKAVEEICVTCSGPHPYYQCLAADGNTFLEYWDNIQGYVAAATGNYNQGNVGYRPPGNNFNQNANYQAPIQQNQSVPLSELEKIKKMNDVNMKAMQAQINNVKNELKNEMQSSIQASMSNQTNELKNMMASFFQINTASTSGLGSLPSNTVANPKGELKAITTRSCLVLDGPSVPMPPPFINPEEDERVEETLTDPEHVGIARDVFVLVGKFTFPTDFIIVDYESDPRVPLILGRPFLQTARALIDVYGEEMILRDGNERLTLNMRHDTSSYSTQPHQESINMIDVYNVSHEEYREDLLATNHLSGNPTSSLTSHTDLTSPEVNDDIFDSEEDIIKNLLNLDKTKYLPPYHDNQLSGNPTPISEPVIKIFTDETRSFTFPSELMTPFDFESDLEKIEYLLNHDPIKEMDSILEDSVDENSLDNNLVDTISEMFTDEHALDYSSPPLWDIMMMTFLILSNYFKPRGGVCPFAFSECDSVFYEDFSEVDALSSTNNEDKVFNPGILIHENLFDVTNCATPEKNVKKNHYSSLILEDFNPPLYELPFHKEVPGLRALLSFSSENEEKFFNPGILTSKRDFNPPLYELPFYKEVPGLEALLSFSSENEEKVFNPGILTSKGIHTSLHPKLSHQGTKAFKVTKILESLMEIFPCSYGEDIRILDVSCLHFYPLDKLKYGGSG